MVTESRSAWPNRSGDPSLARCTWQLIMPGMTVPPPPSIAVSAAPSGSCASGPIQVMRLPSLIRAEPGTGAAPVPSIRLTLRMTTGRSASATKTGSFRELARAAGGDLLVRQGRVAHRLRLMPVVAVDHHGVLLARPVAQRHRASPGRDRVGLAVPRV